MPTLKSNNNIIGVTLGDPGGIGPEVICKALKTISFKKKIFLLAPQHIFDQYKLTLPPSIPYHAFGSSLPDKIDIGQASQNNARWAKASLDEGIRLLKTQQIHSLVTAPLGKASLVKIQPHFIGHTEYLAHAFKIKHVDMMFTTPKLKTVVVTRHDAIRKVPTLLTQSKLQKSISLTYDALKHVFKIKKPNIAVCGLNPHAGEGGLIGDEEIQTIIPVLKKGRASKIHIDGPFAADTLFIPGNLKKYDCIIAMYHDQGLIPIKTLYFDKVVNLTIGLPFIRTSPAHGTAFDLAGKNQADPTSMIEALKLTHTLTRSL